MKSGRDRVAEEEMTFFKKFLNSGPTQTVYLLQLVWRDYMGVE